MAEFPDAYETAERLSLGWVPFGWHARYTPVPMLEFDGIDECGEPVWERFIGWYGDVSAVDR